MKKPSVTFPAALFLLCSLGFSASAIDKGDPRPPGANDLKPGQYIWNPDASPNGPVGIIVDLTHQTLYVYRNGKQIGRATVSTGIQSHPTVPGTYTILTKNKTFHSEKYHEASMPFMERLTWDGMAIHGGNNPGK
ncbi:MAG: L,D-transpeptidase family protein, partial [Rhodospirillales bacterium]|nr:L,D-transpeptidase family protein [Acetobacter sp.]